MECDGYGLCFFITKVPVSGEMKTENLRKQDVQLLLIYCNQIFYIPICYIYILYITDWNIKYANRIWYISCFSILRILRLLDYTNNIDIVYV